MTKTSFSLKFTILGLAVLASVALLIHAFIPLPAATLLNCEKHNGLVLNVVKGGGPGDILVSLKDDNNYYYINRGVDHGVSLSDLAARLTDKTVEILTIKHRSILNPTSTTKHIAQIIVHGSVIYSEL